MGCEACVSQCPFGVSMALPEKGVKCELRNGNPQRVKYCATGEIGYGDLEAATPKKRLRNLDLLLEEWNIQKCQLRSENRNI